MSSDIYSALTLPCSGHLPGVHRAHEASHLTAFRHAAVSVGSSPRSLRSSPFCSTVTWETIYIVESNSGGQNLNSHRSLLLYLPIPRPSLSLTISHHAAALSPRHRTLP